MYVFLPDSNSSPDELLEIMSAEARQEVTEPDFCEREGTVVLPKFKMDYDVDLTQPLRNLGMVAAFGKADFSGISDEPLSISAMRQKTFVAVNEEGTEAAAVTSDVMVRCIIERPKPFQMIMDRPFVFLIHDNERQTILFMGIVHDPGASW
jgi:serine protease inhibitor